MADRIADQIVDRFEQQVLITRNNHLIKGTAFKGDRALASPWLIDRHGQLQHLDEVDAVLTAGERTAPFAGPFQHRTEHFAQLGDDHIRLGGIAGDAAVGFCAVLDGFDEQRQIGQRSLQIVGDNRKGIGICGRIRLVVQRVCMGRVFFGQGHKVGRAMAMCFDLVGLHIKSFPNAYKVCLPGR